MASKKPKLNLARWKAKPQLPILIVFVALFAAVGIGVIGFSRALTPTQSIQPENGTLTNGATSISDSAASNNSAIKFGSASLSGQPMPTGSLVLDGHTWTQIATDDFTKDAALGSWGSACNNNVVYTGATGTQWYSYPSCYLDTYQKRPYRADQVLSVHNGTLDFWLHTVDGKPAGANPSPVVSAGSTYQLYGVYTARFKLSTTALSEFYTAWLLWPQNDGDYTCAESDFPEGQLSSGSFSAFSHYCNNGNQQAGFSKALDKTQWHTFTQLWAPGKRVYYVDNVEIGRATTNVWASPQRWQLQTETNTNCDQVTPNTCTQDGHLLVDWIAVYKY